MAGAIVIVPLYAMAILLSFLSAQLVTTVFYSQSVGTYEHYFHTFLRVDDVMWSFLEVIIMSIIIMLNHCYFRLLRQWRRGGCGRGCGPLDAYLVDRHRAGRPVGLVGALRHRPELQPDGVAP